MATLSCVNCGARSDVGANKGMCPVCRMPLDDARSERRVAAGSKPRSTSAPSGRIVAILLFIVGVVVAIGVSVWRRGATPPPHPPPIVEVAVPLPTTDPIATSAPAIEASSEPREPTGPGEGNPTASFEFHHKAPAYDPAFYVLGVVTNTSQIPIAKPEVIIVFIDEQGKEVGTDHGFALADVLRPGERSYVSAVVTNPPAHREMRFEVNARKVTFEQPEPKGLQVIPSTPRSDGPLMRFWGQVKNTGTTVVSYPEVQVLSFDSADKLLSVHTGYAAGETLAPGASARFEISAVPFGTPVRYEYLISGLVR